MDDTSSAARRRYTELLRRHTPAQRLAIAMSLSRSVRELAVAGIRAARPEASPREVEAELAGAHVWRRSRGAALRARRHLNGRECNIFYDLVACARDEARA